MAIVTAPTQFWIYTGKSLQGPFTIPQIQSKLTTGEVTWGTKVCPVGETQWQPLHLTPGLIPNVQRLVGGQFVPTFPGPTAGAPRPVPPPPLRATPPASTPTPSRTFDPRTSGLMRRSVLGAGVAVIFVIGCFVIRTTFTGSFENYTRADYGDTILRYSDRSYDGAKWTKLKETASFAEMMKPGNTHVTDLFRVAGWDNNNFWVVNQTGQVFQLRDNHWQFAAKPESAQYPCLRVVDQSTLLIANSHLYRLSPGNVTDIGVVDQRPDGELFQADGDLIYSYCTEPIRFATIKSDTTKTVLKVDSYKEATVHRKDNTPLNEHLVGAIRHVHPLRPGVALGVSSPRYGKKKLVKFEGGFWEESKELPDKDIKDLWLSGSADAPHLVLVGKSGWVHVQAATGSGADRTLVDPQDPSKMNLINVWGASQDKFWVMDEHGNVWELDSTTSRIAVRGMRRDDDITFRDAWVSPTGAVFAITEKHLYRLD